MVACVTPVGKGAEAMNTVACPAVVDDRDMAPALAGETAHVAVLLAEKESVPFGAKMVETGSGVTMSGLAGASMAITLPLAWMYSRVVCADVRMQVLHALTTRMKYFMEDILSVLIAC